MRELLEQYDAWRAEGHDVGRAVVIRTYGSSPRQAGSVLLVADDGRMIGSVSGGCIEGAAAQAVLESRERGGARVIRYGVTNEQAWDVGLACGGTIDVLIEPDVPERAVAAARDPLASGTSVLGTTLVTDLPPETPDDLTAALRADPAASATFERLTSANRFAILYRLQDAKRPETRARRLEQYVAMLARGEALYPQKGLSTP